VRFVCSPAFFFSIPLFIFILFLLLFSSSPPHFLSLFFMASLLCLLFYRPPFFNFLLTILFSPFSLFSVSFYLLLFPLPPFLLLLLFLTYFSPYLFHHFPLYILHLIFVLTHIIKRLGVGGVITDITLLSAGYLNPSLANRRS
jgi:hypothetical protein